MTPPNFNERQTSYLPNANFQNNDYAAHFVNPPYNLASNQGYRYNKKNHYNYRWKNKSPNNKRLKNSSYRNAQSNKNIKRKSNLDKIQNRSILLPCSVQKSSEKLKSIETSGKSSQKADISESEKERLRKVEEDRQRIRMALTKKDGHAPLDFKSCIPGLSSGEETEIKGTTSLKLSCPNNSKIVLSESDFREIGVMNDRYYEDFTEDSGDAYNTQIESEDSSSVDDCQIFSPEQASDENRHASDKSENIHKSPLDHSPERSNHERSQSPSCNAKNLQGRLVENVAIDSNANKEFVIDEHKSEKKNRKNSKNDEVVLGYIERDEDLHCVKKVENRLKELNNYSKILSMYRNFMRYRHFAKTDSSLYDRLKLSRTGNLENPLLNREIVDKLKSSIADKGVEGHVETAEEKRLENRANVEEVDEFISIFGDLLDENCTIPAEALCRLGLGYLIFEGNKNFDVSNDSLPTDTNSLLCQNIKQEPVDASDDLKEVKQEPVDVSDDLEEVNDRQQSTGSHEIIHDPTDNLNQECNLLESSEKTKVDENLNRLSDSSLKERSGSSEIECQSSFLQFARSHRPTPLPNSLDRNVPDYCDNLNFARFSSKSALEGGYGFPGSLSSNRETMPVFDPNEYNKSSSLEQMKVCQYMEKKMQCASILDCEPFEVAKSVICSFGKDLLKSTNVSPLLETSFKNLLSVIKNLKDSDNAQDKRFHTRDYCEKRKHDTSNDDVSSFQQFKRMKRTANETFVNNRTLPENTVNTCPEKDSVGQITHVDLDSESESDDEEDVLIEEKSSQEENKFSINFVDVSDRIQSAIASSSSPDCTTRIKTIKVYREDLLLGCCDGQVIRLTNNTSKMRLYRGHTDSVNCINGYKNLLLSGSSDGTVRVSYLLHPFICFHTFVLEEEVATLEVMWGKLFVGTLAGSVLRCNIKNFENCTADKIMVGSTASPILALKASREGPRKIIIVSVRAKPLTIRDARNGLLLHTFDYFDVVYSFAHSTSSSLVYCGTRNTSVVALDLVTGYERKKFQLGKSVVKVILRCNLLYTAAYNGTVHVYNLKEDKILYTNFAPRPIADMEVWCNQMIIILNNFEVVTYSLPSS
ncbi:uncharacterized protein LOC111050726 [Nilaparvata lugens]|uniref:uncharacterized protein LOC111050726 n=1 Tax=Nilaparvata lugens TaxID=108931 RepID=UPI00193C8E2D|nr:uncharacterized protein LOC111050726 [Nilaparvata lugens]